jgi:hypothetical protein
MSSTYVVGVYENMVRRRIFGSKGRDLTGGWRKLYNEELKLAVLMREYILLILPVPQILCSRGFKCNDHETLKRERERERDISVQIFVHEHTIINILQTIPLLCVYNHAKGSSYIDAT